MMTELSLNILDIVENSVKAGAALTEITVSAQTAKNLLEIIIKDNGCGMSEEQVKSVIDPFYTTRTTRKVGLGVPFFKESAELAGGSFFIESKLSVGTTVRATYELDNIDRMPMGDLTATIHTLVTMHEEKDFLFTYKVNENEFVLDTRQLREILGDISFKEYEVSNYIKDYLKENISSVTGEIII
ncbi:MAG: sensor histidine kinase [Clostridia bacterium]|nr:sensor histidine kinase [Clostridia bacterium]MBQ4130775.1 sensor histidine kinase [Clostridia bacterium]MBQ7108674.1 sensor histidine kinase [Clostridia bacterium]MBQ9920432.1 sensor histidine kinase [Clostridia bacterium]